MKTFTNLIRNLALFSLMLLTAFSVQATHFTAPTSSNGLGQWTLFISANINGVDLQAGDEIAIYDGYTCVGSVVLTVPSSEANMYTNQIIAYEVNGSGTTGYTPGHSFTFKCWDASASQEYTSSSFTWNTGAGDGTETNVFPASNTFLWSYPNVTFAQTSGTISLQGAVTQNYGTHAAISGAVVSIVDGSNVTYQAVTNSTGNYIFRDLANDTYSVTVAKSGYKTTTAVSVTINSGTIPVTQDLAMDQADGSVEGTVKDASYHIISGATVTVKNAAGTVTYGTDNTDATGAYSITTVPPGSDYSVTASKTGYQSYTYTSVSVTSGTATYKHFVLTATPGTISGTVTDGDGTAVSGVAVAVTGTSLTATTDGSGAYTIPYVPVGTYSMTFTKTGYHDGSASNVVITVASPTVTQDATIYAKHYTFQSGDPFSNVWTVYLKTVTGDGAALKKDDEVAVYSPTSATNSSASITHFTAQYTGTISAFAAKADGDISAFAFKSGGSISAFAATNTGSISAFSQKSGSITAYADAGGGEVTVTDASHGLVDGEKITISGTTNYNGSFTITYVDANTFKITANWVADDATGSWTGDNTTVTSNAHGLSNGDQVTISGTTNYNGTYNILGVDANNFDIVKAYVANDAIGTWVGNKTTITATSVANLSNGDIVTITGTTNYNGTYTISGTVGSHFDIIKTFVGDDATGNWGTKTTVTSTAHGLSNGDQVTISNTANYDGGPYTIEGVTANTFDIVKAYNGTETGTWSGPTSSTLTTVTTNNTTGLSAGSTITISGTTNYDGTYTVSSLIGSTKFDISKAFVANDATGTWVGDKTMVTSTNSLNTNEVVKITGTTHYDGTYTVTGTNGSRFFITKAYVGDDATGLWYNTNTANMNLVGVYYLTSAINNAGFSNDLIAFSTLADGTTGYTAGLPFVFKLWIAGGSQVSDVHSISWTSTGNGLTNPGTTFPTGNAYSQATIDFDVPPGSIDLTFTKNGTANPDSEINYTLKLNGTAVAGGSGTIATGHNTATISNVDAGTYSLYAYGPRFEDTTYTNIQVYAGGTTHKTYTINYAPGETQNITLHTGYQLISRRVGLANITSFTNTNIAGMDNFRLKTNNFMRDEDSHSYVYSGGSWVNNLTGDGVTNGWYLTKGYIVYLEPTSALTQFSITGTPINYNADIAIRNNTITMISYLPSYNLSASTAFADLKTDDLNYIRATDGSTLRKIGTTWVDNIGTCSPGEGFLINWSGSATTFNYPAQAKSTSAVKGRTNVHYTLNGGDPTGNIFTMYIQGDALEPGDEVAAYDGDKLVGIGVIESSDWKNNDLPIFSRINDQPGYVPGDPITLKVWKASESKEYSADFTAVNKADGDRSYTGDTYPSGDNKYEISDLKLSITGIADQLAASVSLYPNPSDAQMKISAPQIIERIQLVNLMGQKLYEGTPKAKQFIMDVSSYQPGVYFLNLTIDGQPVTKKLSVR